MNTTALSNALSPKQRERLLAAGTMQLPAPSRGQVPVHSNPPIRHRLVGFDQAAPDRVLILDLCKGEYSYAFEGEAFYAETGLSDYRAAVAAAKLSYGTPAISSIHLAACAA